MGSESIQPRGLVKALILNDPKCRCSKQLRSICHELSLAMPVVMFENILILVNYTLGKILMRIGSITPLPLNNGCQSIFIYDFEASNDERVCVQ